MEKEINTMMNDALMCLKIQDYVYPHTWVHIRGAGDGAEALSNPCTYVARPTQALLRLCAPSGMRVKRGDRVQF